MLNNILNLKGATALSKQELKSINGGSGTCMYYNGKIGVRQTGLSMTQAKGLLRSPCDHWCCDSCATVSWASAPTLTHLVDLVSGDSTEPLPPWPDPDC